MIARIRPDSHHFSSALLQLPRVRLTSNFTHFLNASQVTCRKGKSSVVAVVVVCFFAFNLVVSSLADLSTKSEILPVPVYI